MLCRTLGSFSRRLPPQAISAGVCRCQSTQGLLYYQGGEVPTSVRTTGKVYTARDLAGSDSVFVGVDPQKTEVEILDGRGRGFTVDQNGFQLAEHAWQHIDYYDNSQVLDVYYPECEELLKRTTGASRVLAFDHNIRAKQQKSDGRKLDGGNSVQEPLIGYGIHNDYTMTSAPARIRLLSEPPKENDTRRRADGQALIDPGEVNRLLKGRWGFFNAWRNITTTPVERFPLGVCDAQSTSTEDLVVFEIRYADRVGENYFARSSDRHRWYYYPRLTRDEVVVLKCWDSRGRDFIGDEPALQAMLRNGSTDVETVPATFSLHTGFVDLNTREDAPDRESIEVRMIAFWDDAE